MECRRVGIEAGRPVRKLWHESRQEIILACTRKLKDEEKQIHSEYTLKVELRLMV